MSYPKFYILFEKDVGLFSLIQQVINHIPIVEQQKRIPIVFFTNRCCYWAKDGYHDRDTVWEYYFEPVIQNFSVSKIPNIAKDSIMSFDTTKTLSGFTINENIFATNHFGDHPDFKGKSLKIPYKWNDPNQQLRIKSSHIISQYIRPRNYIQKKVDTFINNNMKGNYVIGTHIRGTDVTDKQEHNFHRRASYDLNAYKVKIRSILKNHQQAKIFIATDSLAALKSLEQEFPNKTIHYSSIFHHSGNVSGTGPTGWSIPGYLANDSQKAALNGEEAVIDYLLLSHSDFLIHNGSGLARTALLKSHSLDHYNVHSKKKYLLNLLPIWNLELYYILRIYLRNSFFKLYHIFLKRIGKS